MLPVIQFLGLTLPVGPLFAILAFFAGSELAARAIHWFSSDDRASEWAEAFNTATFIALIAGLLGARLGYAAKYLSLYLADPRLLLSLRPGTLALVPGLIIGVIAGVYVLRRKGVPLALVADITGIGVAAGLAVLSVGQFLTGDAYGVRSDVPWAVELWGAYRHPVQLYVAAALLSILALLWWWRKSAAPGETFWRFVMLYSASTLFLDAFHANEPTWGPGIRTAQVISLVALLAAMFVLSYYAKSRETSVDSSFAGTADSDTYLAMGKQQ
jgi:phosphatidylglycerol:prolipoprotein diacylglycerol transferase